MKHESSVVTVYFTKDYGRFNCINGNRPLNEKKIKKIIDDIDGGLDMLKYCPIVVYERNGRLDIIDGQHRFYVAKTLKSHVWYVLLQEELTLRNIASVNSRVERWKKDDFVNCNVMQGNEHYTVLREFAEIHGLAYTTSAALLSYGTIKTDGGASTGKLIEDGLFEVKYKKEAEAVMVDVNRFAPATWRRTGAFICALCKIRTAGLVPIADVAEAFVKHSDKIIQQKNVKGWMHQMEIIMNIGKGKRVLLW